MFDSLQFDANSLVTLLVGFVAFGIYSKQKWDRKRNAAKAIYIEIQTAEANLSKVKDELTKNTMDIEVPENIFLMPIESWSVNRQDFIKDFRPDEWSAIDDFYSKCKLYDQNARYNAQAFVKNEEQIRVNAHRLTADYVDMLVEQMVGNDQKNEKAMQKAWSDFHKRKDFIETQYLGSIRKPIYKPQKYMDQAQIHANTIEPLLLSTVGKKLDSIANRGWIRNMLHLYVG